MTKRYFMAILALRLARMIKSNPNLQMVRVNQQDLASEDRSRAANFIDSAWL